MAGEWIPLDINLGAKPEVQELIDLTGQGVETVVYRLLQLWGWASMNSADGTVRATPGRMARVCGGDDAFWLAVQSVGWIVFDQEAGTAEIPGWGRRFSQAAKARACHSDRQSRYRDGRVTVQRHESVTRGEERREQVPPPPQGKLRSQKKKSTEAPVASDAPASTWDGLRDSWNSGTGERWRSPVPPAAAAQRLAEDGWIDRAAQAIERLPLCLYFKTPVTLGQFCGDGFADRVLGGQYDKAKEKAPQRISGRPDEKAPPHVFSGDDAARFEATKRRMLEQLKIQSG